MPNKDRTSSKEKKQAKKTKTKRTKTKRPVWKTALLCFLCLVMLVSGVGMIYFYNIVGAVNYKPIHENSNKNKTSSLTSSGDPSLD